jgi:hypothetical protein
VVLLLRIPIRHQGLVPIPHIYNSATRCYCMPSVQYSFFHYAGQLIISLSLTLLRVFLVLALFRLSRPFCLCALSLYIYFLLLSYILLFVCFFSFQSASFVSPLCKLFRSHSFSAYLFHLLSSFRCAFIFAVGFIPPLLFHTHFLFMYLYFSSCFPLRVQLFSVSLLCPLSVLSFSIPVSL